MPPAIGGMQKHEFQATYVSSMLIINNNEDDDNKKKLFQRLQITCHVHKWHARLLSSVCLACWSFIPSSLGDTKGVSVPRRQRLQAPLWAVKPKSLLRAVWHSPQPQVECCRPSPFNPDRAAFTCSHCLHSSGREARSPTWSIQGSGPAHPRTLPPTTLSPSLSPWWDTSSAQGPRPGSSCICRGRSRGPTSSCWGGEWGKTPVPYLLSGSPPCMCSDFRSLGRIMGSREEGKASTSNPRSPGNVEVLRLFGS